MSRRAAPENVVKLSRQIVAALSLKPGQRERTIWDADLPSFGCRLQGSRKTWVVRLPRPNGRSGLAALGSVDAIGVAQAREAAKRRLAEDQLGIGPPRVTSAPPAASFIEAAKRYMEQVQPNLKPANYKDLQRHINRDFVSLHKRPVDQVTRAEVWTCIDALAARAPASANRARSVISTFFLWAMTRGLVENNPVIGTLKPAKEVRRDRVLDHAELLTVWREVGEDDFGRIIRLLIILGQRRDEVAAMTWSEIDVPNALWTLPAERSKNGRRHLVPLSSAALSILNVVPRRDGRRCVFGRGDGPYSGFSKAKQRLDEKAKLTRPWVIHDLRRSCATGLAELGVLPHVIEAVLNHVSGTKAGVAGTYNRNAYEPEKRAALDRWAAHIEALVS